MSAQDPTREQRSIRPNVHHESFDDESRHTAADGPQGFGRGCPQQCVVHQGCYLLARLPLQPALGERDQRDHSTRISEKATASALTSRMTACRVSSFQIAPKRPQKKSPAEMVAIGSARYHRRGGYAGACWQRLPGQVRPHSPRASRGRDRRFIAPLERMSPTTRSGPLRAHGLRYAIPGREVA